MGLADRLLPRLAARKPLAHLQPRDQPQLRRALNRWHLLFFALSSSIGIGIFALSGAVVSQYAGPASALSFLLAGTGCAFSGLAYAEFASRVPVAGSAYTYAYVSVGEFFAWIVGWDLTLEYAICAAAVARGWVNYFVLLADVLSGTDDSIPTVLYDYCPGGWDSFCSIFSSSGFSILAVLVILMCGLLAIIGIKESVGWSGSFLASLTVFGLLFFIIVGASQVDVENWSNFAPYGVDGILSCTGILFFIYLGFDTVTVLSEEAINPQTDIAFAIIGSLAIETVIFASVVLVMSGVIPYYELSSESTLSSVLIDAGLTAPGVFIAFVALISATTGVLTSIVGQPRIFYRLAVDGLLCPAFASINPYTRTPAFSTIITLLIAIPVAFLMDLETLSEAISVGTLISFTVVCFGLMVMRYQTFKRRRAFAYIFALLVLAIINGVLVTNSLYYYTIIPLSVAGVVLYSLYQIKQTPPLCRYVCPFVPLLPFLGMVFNCIMMGTLSTVAWIRFLLWLCLGLIIYAVYGFNHSKLASELNVEGETASANVTALELEEQKVEPAVS